MPTRDHKFISQLGATFFLTSSIIGWRHVFIKQTLLDMLIKCIKFYQDNRQVRTVGYCLMPNHIHWLFHIKDKKIDAIEVLRTFKSYVATQTIKCLRNYEYMKIEPLHFTFRRGSCLYGRAEDINLYHDSFIMTDQSKIIQRKKGSI